jgi:hypothetical protein
MKTNILLIALLACIASFTASAQDEFKVLIVSGKITSENGKAVTTGSKITANQEIEVGERSYVSLMHKSGKTLELSKQGSYKVQDLSKDIATKSTASLSEKYANYVLKKLTDEKANLEGNYQSYMAVTGSVERDLNNLKIRLFLPASTELLENNQVLAWSSVKNADGYTVTITDMFDKALIKQQLADTTFSVSIKQLLDAAQKAGSNNSKTFLITVTANSNKNTVSAKHALKLAPESRTGKVKKELEALKAELGDTQTTLSQLLIASFYELNDFHAEAIALYRNVVARHPEVEDYQKLYKDYLMRIGAMPVKASAK